MARRKKREEPRENKPEEPLFVSDEEKIIEIEVTRLRAFKDHPFKVKDDDSMKQLKNSIRKYGILTPLVVRPSPEGFYEIVSGHRRMHCAVELGYQKVPVIIRYMEDEESVISMVDANLHRQTISYSEKAFAYKMKNDAMKRKAGKRRKTQKGKADQLKGRKTVELIGEQVGDSPRQVTRYIRLTKLIPELLEKLDEGKISFNPAVDLSFLTEEEQHWVLNAIEFTQAVPSLSQTHRIKEMSRQGTLTRIEAIAIMNEVKKNDGNRVSFKNEQLYRFFPKDYTAEQIKEEILSLLEQVYR